MPALPELQRAFAQAMLRPDAGVSKVGVLVSGHLNVYIEGYKARLTEALRDNFPTLHRTLGDETFNDLAHAYIDDMPSRYRSIRWFGRELADFARGDASRLPHAALLDLMRMDWAIGTALDAADALPLRAAQLQALAPEQWATLALALHPSVTLLRLDWAIEPIWQAATRELNQEGASEDSTEPAAAPHHLLIWREGLDARWRVLPAMEACVFEQIDGERSFSALCATLVTQTDETDAPQLAATFLSHWVTDGILADTLTAASSASKSPCRLATC